MKKRMIQLTALACVMCLFSGCSMVQTSLLPLIPTVTEESDLPHRMVQRIDVELNEKGEGFERHYQSQENLTMILRLLREMSTKDIPEEAPTLDATLSYYTITATYASGEQQFYRLLSGQYLKMGESDWLAISPELAAGFIGYLEEHQSDDGSYIPPETLPVETGETTAPAETQDA